MDQMDQKHKVCVHYGILNASLSTDREEDNYLPSAQRAERKAFGKGGAAHQCHLAVDVWNCSEKETCRQNEIPKYNLLGLLCVECLIA